MGRELARKAIHLSTAALPVAVWMAPREVAVAVLVPLAAVAVAADATRLRWRPARYRFLRHLRPVLRHRERRGFTGATYMVVAYALAVLLFPKPVAVAAMLFNGLGDAAAALVGKRWGRHRTRWGKSWEGFGAELAVNLAVALAVSRLDPRLALSAAVFGAAVAAVLEFLDLPIDDNVRITLGGAAAIWAAQLILA
jgi:dolichol kinase